MHLDRSPFTCSCEGGAGVGGGGGWRGFHILHFYWSFSDWRCVKHGGERVKVSDATRYSLVRSAALALVRLCTLRGSALVW